MKRSPKFLTAFAAVLGIAGSLWMYRSTTENTRKIASAEDKTILEGFNYRLSNLGSVEEAQDLFDGLSDDLGYNPMNTCYNRSHVWAHQMNSHKNVQAGKIFLFYTKKTWRNGWWFHVAPYVVVNGEEYVMENFFDFKGPMKMSEWIAKQTGETQCAELNPRADANLYKILKKKKPHVFPSTGVGRDCYTKRTPMTYLSTYSVYLHDKKGYRYDTLDPTDVRLACEGSMGSRFEPLANRKQMCAAFMANPTSTFGKKAAPLPLTGNAVEPGDATSDSYSTGELDPTDAPAER